MDRSGDIRPAAWFLDRQDAEQAWHPCDPIIAYDTETAVRTTGQNLVAAGIEFRNMRVKKVVQPPPRPLRKLQ